MQLTKICSRSDCGSSFNYNYDQKLKGRHRKYCSEYCQRLNKPKCKTTNCLNLSKAKGLCGPCYYKNWFKESRIRKQYNCTVCGDEFNSETGRRKYCSKNCSKRSKKLPVLDNKNCEVCGVDFQPRHSTPPQRFCSSGCRKKAENKRNLVTYTIECELCGSKITANRRRKFCSEQCRGKFNYIPRIRKLKELNTAVRPPRGTAVIYYLRNMNSNEVVYIGSTKEEYSSRLAKHKSSHRPIKGLKPHIDFIEIEPVFFVPITQRFEYESLAIKTAYNAGWPIVNKRLPDTLELLNKSE